MDGQSKVWMGVYFYSRWLTNNCCLHTYCTLDNDCVTFATSTCPAKNRDQTSRGGGLERNSPPHACVDLQYFSSFCLGLWVSEGYHRVGTAHLAGWRSSCGRRSRSLKPGRPGSKSCPGCPKRRRRPGKRQMRPTPRRGSRRPGPPKSRRKRPRRWLPPLPPPLLGGRQTKPTQGLQPERRLQQVPTRRIPPRKR